MGLGTNSGFNRSAADRWAGSRDLSRATLAVGILGQSNERGQVDPTEAISGVVSRNDPALRQAFGSLRNPALRYPISPANAKYGGMWFKFYDDLYDWGYDAHIVNRAIGSASMIRDICGQIQARANNTSYRARRSPLGHGDFGYAGDYMVAHGRVFLCTTGIQAFASNANGYGDTGTNDIDYLKTVGANTTAASEPAGLATANVGDVITDGTIQWKCLSTSTTYNGYSYTAGSICTESRAGFDPFSLCHVLLKELQSIRDARKRIVLLANAQSDTGNANLLYQQALETIGGFFLQRGISVAVGLSFYQPSVGTTIYNNLTTRVNNAIATYLAGAGTYYVAEDVITGANLYTLLGSTGNMASGGAYFAKDSGQDNIHVNALGAIAGGAQWASAVKGAIPQLASS